MNLFDLHTHRSGGATSQRIVNIRFPEPFAPVEGEFYSIGIHPWDVNCMAEIDWEMFRQCALHPQVLAIGECGLDKGVHAELWDEQKQVFTTQAQLSEELCKPMIIHNVRAMDELLSIRKCGSYTMPWVLHGFRGKPELALQAVASGFYLSFGIQYNEETLRSIPRNRLLLETDDSGQSIRLVYERATATLGISIEELVHQVSFNRSKLLHR